MGYRCRWIAARGTSMEDMLEHLGFSITEQSGEAIYDPGLYAVELTNGWIVVMGDGWDFMDKVPREKTAALSKRGDSIYFYTDDTPMDAELAAFRAGREVWSLTYSGSNGVASPVITGAPPEIVRVTIAALEKEQEVEGPDQLYEAAPVIALELVGFRHDQTLSSGDLAPIFSLG